MRNFPNDHHVLAAVNEEARLLVNAESDDPVEQRLPPGFRCDMSRIGFIRRRWERAVKTYKERTGIDAIEALARIEAEIRRNTPVLHIERR